MQIIKVNALSLVKKSFIFTLTFVPSIPNVKLFDAIFLMAKLI